MQYQHVKYHSVAYWHRRLNDECVIKRQDFVLLWQNFRLMLEDYQSEVDPFIRYTLREYDERAVNACFTALYMHLRWYPGWYTAFRRISLNERYRRFVQFIGYTDTLGA